MMFQYSCRFSESGGANNADEKLHLRIESGDKTVQGACWNNALYMAAGALFHHTYKNFNSALMSVGSVYAQKSLGVGVEQC